MFNAVEGDYQHAKAKYGEDNVCCMWLAKRIIILLGLCLAVAWFIGYYLAAAIAILVIFVWLQFARCCNRREESPAESDSVQLRRSSGGGPSMTGVVDVLAGFLGLGQSAWAPTAPPPSLQQEAELKAAEEYKEALHMYDQAVLAQMHQQQPQTSNAGSEAYLDALDKAKYAEAMGFNHALVAGAAQTTLQSHLPPAQQATAVQSAYQSALVQGQEHSAHLHSVADHMYLKLQQMEATKFAGIGQSLAVHQFVPDTIAPTAHVAGAGLSPLESAEAGAAQPRVYSKKDLQEKFVAMPKDSPSLSYDTLHFHSSAIISSFVSSFSKEAKDTFIAEHKLTRDKMKIMYTAAEIYLKLNISLQVELKGLSKEHQDTVKKTTMCLLDTIHSDYQKDLPDIVYRGLACSQVLAGRYQQIVGKTVYYYGFTSTSRLRSQAEKFADDKRLKFGGVPTILKVHLKKGRRNTASDVSAISKYPDEKEVLIGPNAGCHVIDVQKCTVKGHDGMEIEMELVDEMSSTPR
eukprot:6367238-Prymnesium_polylepis.1